MRRALAIFTLLVACGDDAGEAVPGAGDAGVLDAGPTLALDAMASIDARPPEVRDDSAVALESYAQCAGDSVTLPAARVTGRSFSLAVLVERIYLAYPVASCGGSNGASFAQGLSLVSMRTTGNVAPATPLVDTEACSRTALPVLAASQGALRLFYASNRTGATQLFVQDAQDAGAAPEQLTREPAPVDDMAVRLDRDRAPQLVYARAGAIEAQRIGALPQLLLRSDEGHRIGQLAASALGDGNTGMVAWVNVADDKPGIYLRFFDDAGSAVLEPLAPAGPRSSVAVATQATRGAVIYSDDYGALFFRTLELDRTLGEPVRLTSGNQFVSDVAVARYGVAYAVVFRAKPESRDMDVLRLLMLDEHGNQAAPRVISELRRDGHGLEVRVANDGRVIVAWAEPSDDGATSLRVARLTCL